MREMWIICHYSESQFSFLTFPHISINRRAQLVDVEGRLTNISHDSSSNMTSHCCN